MYGMSIQAMAVSVSGMMAAQKRLATSAENVANQLSAASEGVDGALVNQPYVPKDVVQISQEAGGVQSQNVPRDPASVAVADEDSSLADDSGVVNYPNVDLAEEAVNQQVAVYDFKANLKAFQAQDNMIKEAIDMLA
jgi:flagellar basal body rod protein FlgC